MHQSFCRGSIRCLSLSRRQYTAAFLDQCTELFFHVFREEGCSAQLQKFRFHAQEPGDHFLCGFFGDSAGRCKDQEIFSTKVPLLSVHRQRKLLVRSDQGMGHRRDAGCICHAHDELLRFGQCFKLLDLWLQNIPIRIVDQCQPRLLLI